MLLPRSVGGDQVEPWTYMRAIEEIARADGSVGWNSFVANSSALIAPYIPIEAARTIYSDPRGLIAWGPPNQHRAIAAPGGYRVTGEWHFASGSRQANWMGAHCHVVEPDGSLRLNRFGRPTVRTLLMPKDKTTPIATGTRSACAAPRPRLCHHRRVRAGGVLRHARGSDPAAATAGPLYAFTDPGPLCGRRRRRGARHRRRHARGLHGARRPRRRRATWRGSPTIRWCSRRWRGTRRRSARRAPIWSTSEGLLGRRRTTSSRWARPSGARVRLGCSQAILASLEVGRRGLQGGRHSAIFLGTPFERRFRDIHTLSQQIQSREAHFEAVGRVMLNGDPDNSFLG
jgi:hypothetical protein